MNAEMNRVLRQMARKIDETVQEAELGPGEKMVFGKVVKVGGGSSLARKKADLKAAKSAKGRKAAVTKAAEKEKMMRAMSLRKGTRTSKD